MASLFQVDYPKLNGVNMKKILITGSNGYVARNIAKNLCKILKEKFYKNDLFSHISSVTLIKQPQYFQPKMQKAAQLPETFYGILASETLGMVPIASKAAKIAKLELIN